MTSRMNETEEPMQFLVEFETQIPERTPESEVSDRTNAEPASVGIFLGSALSIEPLPWASADWQIILPDGTALGDVRYTLHTVAGALLYVQSRGIRHCTAEVLARVGCSEDGDASEYTFRTS